MPTELVKWLSIVALLLAMAFWPSASLFQRELDVVVSVAAGMILVQAYRTQNYTWAAAFLGIALLFNPVYPVFRLSGILGLALVVFAIAPFTISLVALRPSPMLSTPASRSQ